MHEVEDYFLDAERRRSKACSRSRASASPARAQNAGMGFVLLKDWSERDSHSSASALQAMANRAFCRGSRTRRRSRSRRRR